MDSIALKVRSMVIRNEITLADTLGRKIEIPSSQLRRKLWNSRYGEGEIESEANALGNAKDRLTGSQQCGR